MKTIKTWLVTIAALLCSITASAHSFEIDGIYYNVTSSTDYTVAVTYRGSTGGEYTNEYSGAVIIPSSVTYNGKIYSVTSIGELAFFNCSSLTAISIPESVTSIGSSYERAFERCIGLKAITVNSNNPVYDSRNNCNAIIETASNTLILGSASTIIPEGITSIGKYAFSDNISLTTINIPESVTNIGSSAFSNCSSLVSITLPEGVTGIGNSAFDGCSSLTDITIPESVTDLGSRAFRGCKGELTINCNIPDRSYAYSYEGPFSHSEFSKVIIGDNVTIIGTDAFSGSSTISTLIVGNSLVSISDRAFPRIEKIFWMCNLPLTTYWWKGKINYTSNSDYASSSEFKVYPMLNSMFEVDGITFVPTSMSERTCDVIDYDCNRTATSVNVGATVMYKNVEFTVNNVNDYAFYGNQHLEEITLANQGGVGTYAFANCAKLTTVNIAKGVTSVGYALFEGCNELATISVAEENAMYDSRNNCNAIIEKATNKLVAACNQTVIPESVTAIGDYAFSACGEMTSISIHKDILSVGNYAFSGCSSLADVTIEDRTEVLTLGSNGNKALFSDCSLISVYIGGKISYDTSSSKGYSPFSNNTSLRTVTITDKVETIYPYEFYNCSALKSVTIGDGASTIGDYAFSGCTSLESFTLGSMMKTIGVKAFLGCGKITAIMSGTINPPVCGANALDDLDKWNCTLYTPIGYKSAYQAADQWKEFLLMEDNIPIKKYTLTFLVDGNVYHTESLAYDESVVLPDNPEKEGYAFIEWEGLPQTMPSTDIAVNASFAINEYTLTYVVDDEEYAKETVVYGATIEPKAAPTKEGHTFGGWSEIPKTMPATDVTIIGSFTVNSYLLTYIIDGTVYDTKSVAYGSEIVMLEAPEKTGYTFDGWDTNLSVMPAEDVVINGSYTRLPIEDFVINDGNDSEFILEEDLQCKKITYTRTFNNTNWQALYVPFEIPVTADSLEDYDVAYFNDIHSYDEYVGDKENGISGSDGVIDRMDMEVLKVQEGTTLNANYPYLIRAKNKEALNMNIKVEDATLYKTGETTVSCSSVFMRFDVTGIYTTQTAGELKGEFDVYAMSGGGWKQALSESQQLKPFRLYLKLTSIDGSPVKVAQSAMKAIRIRVDGEDETTEIENAELMMNNSELIFDLQGHRVENPGKGIYIVNGKKTVIK